MARKAGRGSENGEKQKEKCHKLGSPARVVSLMRLGTARIMMHFEKVSNCVVIHWRIQRQAEGNEALPLSRRQYK